MLSGQSRIVIGLLVLAASSSQIAGAAEPYETAAIVEAGGKILNGCATKALKNVDVTKTIKKCLDDGVDKYKKEAKFPQEMFQAYVDPYQSFGALNAGERTTKWKAAEGSLDEAKRLAKEFLNSLPFQVIACEHPDVRSSIAKITNQYAMFSGAFDANYVLEKPIGGESKDGTAFLVKKKGYEKEESQTVLKVVWTDPFIFDAGEKLPREFLIQEQLAKLKILNANIAPMVFAKDHAKLLNDRNELVMEYIVMERLGSTLAEFLLNPEGDPHNPHVKASIPVADLFGISKRMYTVLKTVHKDGGVAHLDLNLNNWAFRCGSTEIKDLMLFDFGRSRFMKTARNFGLLLRDLLKWKHFTVYLVQEIGLRKNADDNEMLNKVMEILKKLQGLLAKLIWNDETDPEEIFSPFADFAVSSYKDMMKNADFKAFMTAADAWETTDVKQWLPKHRRKRAPVELSEDVKNLLKKPEKLMSHSAPVIRIPASKAPLQTAPLDISKVTIMH